MPVDRDRFDPVTLASVAAFHTRSVAAATYHADPVLRICRQYAPSLNCQVSDDGRADQDATRSDPSAWPRKHGHGLWIIDKVADTVTLDRDRARTTVTVTFIFSSPS